MNVLITGGAGFIGSNLAAHWLELGYKVRILDNLSRSGTEKNVAWLESLEKQNLEVVQEDIRDSKAVSEAIRKVDVVVHLAAQVAVTTSVTDPRIDFEINTAGTLNVLEALRQVNPGALLLYTSTNKVYGRMEEVSVADTGSCYVFSDYPEGIPETYPLDFHSPYGCSKGAADAYVRDYARIYDLRTVVFRMSCIYGTRQFGNEDQGWLAHFIISAVLSRPITIYGDGKQVRDLLYVDDLIEAMQLAIERIDIAAGQVYNIGGGPGNTLSVWAELEKLLTQRLGREIPVQYGDWRPGDQPVYVSDIGKAGRDLKWVPRVSVEEGVDRLWTWVMANKELFD